VDCRAGSPALRANRDNVAVLTSARWDNASRLADAANPTSSSISLAIRPSPALKES